MTIIADLRNDVHNLVTLDEVNHAHEYPPLRDRLVAIYSTVADLSISTEVAYLIGYLFYLDINILDKSPAVPWFQISITSPDPHIKSVSAMYRGHIDYDAGRFNEALHWFMCASDTDLESKYLSAKLLELRACCHIKIHDLDDSLHVLQEYSSLLHRYDADDIWPHELAITIEAAVAPAEAYDILLQIARDIDSTSRQPGWIEGIVQAKTPRHG